MALNFQKPFTQKDYCTHKNIPKMGQNIIESLFSRKNASGKGKGPLQALEIGPFMGPYFVVFC